MIKKKIAPQTLKDRNDKARNEVRQKPLQKNNSAGAIKSQYMKMQPGVVTKGKDVSAKIKEDVKKPVKKEVKKVVKKEIVKKMGNAKEVKKTGPAKPKGKTITATMTPADIEAGKKVLEEQNLVRGHPKEYAQKLRKFLPLFKGNILNAPGSQCGLMTNEGPKAYKEAIAFLEKANPLPPLIWNDGLAKAAFDQANDVGTRGVCEHSGADGSSPSERAKRYLKTIGCGENISCGHGEPESIIIQLLVDDGVPSRGHRGNIFRPTYEICGIGVAPHKAYGHCCVLDYIEKGSYGILSI